MKRMMMTAAAMMTAVMLWAQGVYTRQCDDERLKTEAAEWAAGGAWRNGFDIAGPHKSVNLTEFYTQYQKNTAQWEAMFGWLAENDLTGIPKGKYPIGDSGLTASVEDSENSPIEKRRSESHYHHIDFQLVVKGTERFALLDHNTSVPNCEWKPDVIRYDYDVEKTMFIDSTPDEFLIFFPDDWHIAKIANDTDDQTIRVIVVKLDYVE